MKDKSRVMTSLEQGMSVITVAAAADLKVFQHDISRLLQAAASIPSARKQGSGGLERLQQGRLPSKHEALGVGP